MKGLEAPKILHWKVLSHSVGNSNTHSGVKHITAQILFTGYIMLCYLMWVSSTVCFPCCHGYNRPYILTLQFISCYIYLFLKQTGSCNSYGFISFEVLIFVPVCILITVTVITTLYKVFHCIHSEFNGKHVFMKPSVRFKMDLIKRKWIV